MAEEVDRRGFMRLWRRSSTADDEAEPERELTPEEQELADFTARLLADVASEDEEQLADGPLLTRAKDQAYMRVTGGHIVYSTVIGSSALIKTADVTAFDTEPPIEADARSSQVMGLLRAHHPADPPNITRPYGFRFPIASPLLAAIRTACNIPEPEPEEATGDAEGTQPEPADAEDQ